MPKDWEEDARYLRNAMAPRPPKAAKVLKNVRDAAKNGKNTAERKTLADAELKKHATDAGHDYAYGKWRKTQTSRKRVSGIDD